MSTTAEGGRTGRVGEAGRTAPKRPKTIFGEEVNPLEQTDLLFAQLVNILYANEDFNAALAVGALTPEANVAIAGAFDEVFDRNQRLANIFLSDKQAREEVTSFWFARAYAEVQASKVYNDAFRRAFPLSKIREAS